MLDKTVDYRKPENKLTRKKAIRKWCLECSAYQPGEVRKCEHYHCPLWPYRMGREVKEK